MKSGELKSIGIASGLIALNIAVMWIFAFTPLSQLNNLLFDTFFLLGVIVYGGLLTIGSFIAKRGIRQDRKQLAGIGTSIVQFAYGIFGAGIISFLPVNMQGIALGITALVSVIIAILSGLLVYGTGHDFSSWGKYANYIFLAVIGISFIGSFSGPFILVAFALTLIGFIIYLIHEIYMVKTRPRRPFLNGIGIYVAFMGVFVQILQIVVRMLADE